MAEAYTLFAECKLEAERELRKIDKLNYVILRPGIIYGIGDRVGLSKHPCFIGRFIRNRFFTV